MIKKIICMSALFAIMLSFSGCTQKASKYTEEEHIQRVTERIQTRYINGEEKLRPYDKSTDDAKIQAKVKATNFEVYPLCDKNDKLKHFLVEFEPYGFLYVLLRDEQLKAFGWLGASTSMYMLSNVEGEPSWSQYAAEETDNENGERIIYYNSPYSVACLESERIYLLRTERGDGGYIPAVKRDGQYLNLISMGLFSDSISEKETMMNISLINKKHFDL